MPAVPAGDAGREPPECPALQVAVERVRMGAVADGGVGAKTGMAGTVAAAPRAVIAGGAGVRRTVRQP